MREVYMYSEQSLTPRAAEVIRGILDANGYSDVRFKDASANGVGKDRTILVFGNQLPNGIWDGVKFITTYSLAQIMAKANSSTVLCAALRLYFGEAHVIPKHLGPLLVNSDEEPKHYGYAYDEPVVIDIETGGNLGVEHTPEEVPIISVGFYQAGCMPLVYAVENLGTGGTLPLTEHSGIYRMLQDELPKFEYVIYHNGKFDMRVLNRYFDIKLKNSFDTMLAHHVLNHAAGAHGLKHLAQQYLGAPDWEDGIKKHLKKGGHYELIPIDKLVLYNGWDVYWTYQLYELFRPQIEQDENNEMAFMLEMQAADMLLEVEATGIPFRRDVAISMAEAQEHAMRLLKLDMAKITSREDFNPNSPKQVKEALIAMGVPNVTSTDEKHINQYLKDYKDNNTITVFLESLLSYRKANKIKGTYAEGWMKHERNGRVHPTFLVHGTSTGRLSSTQPNAQNMPRDTYIRGIVGLE